MPGSKKLGGGCLGQRKQVLGDILGGLVVLAHGAAAPFIYALF